MTNKEIIAQVFSILGEQLDRNLYLFDNIIEERENLQYIDTSKYREIAGMVVKLNATKGADSSTNATLVMDKQKDTYIEERQVILRYLLTKINFELADKHEEAYSAAINTLKGTIRTFNDDFLYCIYLIVLFDGDREYTHLCRPIADFAVNVLYNEEEEGI